MVGSKRGVLHRRNISIAVFAVWLACLELVGCATTSADVRALRMYQQEEPTPQLLDAHLGQMQESLSLIRKLLHETPYQPGADWVGELALDEAKAERAEELTSDPACRASFVCIHNAHVRDVLSRAGQAPGAEDSGRRYPSISAALAELDPAFGKGKPSAAAPLTPESRAAIAKDAWTVTSVALRLGLEARALATVVALEASALSKRPSWIDGSAMDSAKLARQLPSRGRAIFGDLVRNVEDLARLVDRLSALQGVEPGEAPGLRYADGLVDDIAGFGWDSVHVDLQAGGRALFYNALASPEVSGEAGGDSYDYTGRLTRLEYDVEPIVLANAQAAVKVDWPEWPDAMRLDLGYATNRGYKSGGDVTTGSIANELGASDGLSDALSAALAVADVQANVEIATFTQGRVRDVLIDDGSVIAEAPFTFQFKQIDLGYDLAPHYNPLVQKVVVGFRYFDYSLPRILYELENATPDLDTAAYVYSRETPPQAVRTQLYMLNAVLGLARAVTPHLTPYASLDFAVGFGPTEYYFLLDDFEPDEENNRERVRTNSPGMALTGLLGIRWHVGGPGASFNAYLDARYEALYIDGFFDATSEGDTIVNFGGSDVFHGPSAALGVTF